MTARHEVLACARQFLGVRFAHQGRSKAGLDCLGLLLATAIAADIHFSGASAMALDVPTYGHRPDTALLKERLDQFLEPAVGPLMPADVVLLCVDQSPQHLALLTDYPMAGELGMIHAYAPVRAVVEHRYDAHWKAATVAAYRLPEIH